MATITEGNRFLAPNKHEKHIVFLSDKQRSLAIMLTEFDSVVLNGEAADIAFGSYFNPRSRKINSILGSRSSAQVRTHEWLKELKSGKAFTFATKAPRRGPIKTRSVRKGAEIVPPNVVGVSGISVELAGKLKTRAIGNSTIHWYEASKSLSQMFDFEDIVGPGSVRGSGHVIGNLIPNRGIGSVGANCNICAVCGACGGCGICGPTAAAALALVAIDAVVGVAGSSLSAEVLRNASVRRF